MNLHSMKLVTIVCESVLEERIVEVLGECGAHGHTAFDVRGGGSQGTRSADLVESGNVQIQVIAKPAVAEVILQRLHADFFRDYAMVAYVGEVSVMRPDKF